MDVDDAAAGEDLLELVVLQLVVTGAAADDDSLDVEVIERVGNAVKEHAVVGDDLFGLVELARAALRIAAAEIPRRQHCLHARMPEHRLCGQPDLAEEPLRAAAGEVEDGFAVAVRALRVTDDGHVACVFDVEQRPRSPLGQAGRHFLVDEVNDLLRHRRAAAGGRGRPAGLLPGGEAEEPIAQTLRLVAPLEHQRARDLDRLRVLDVQEKHRRGRAGVELLPAHAAQEVAHRHGYVAEVDVHRTGRQALVADGAVVGHVAELVPVLDRDAAPCLLLVEKCLDQQ